METGIANRIHAFLRIVVNRIASIRLGSGPQPGTQHVNGIFFSQARSCGGNLVRDPLREGQFVCDMTPRGGVKLLDAGDLLPGELISCSDERSPDATMNVGDLTADQAADENILGVAYGTSDCEDLMASRMPPPASTNRFTDDCMRQGGHRTGGRFENDSVLPDERNGLGSGHLGAFGLAGSESPPTIIKSIYCLTYLVNPPPAT